MVGNMYQFLVVPLCDMTMLKLLKEVLPPVAFSNHMYIGNPVFYYLTVSF